MRYHDSESDPDECLRVEERLASDERARAELVALRASSSAVRRWAETAAMDDITDRVMSRIEGSSERGGRLLKLRRISWSLAASGLAAAACLWLWLGTATVETDLPGDPGASVELPAVAPVARAAQPLAEVGAGVAIERLDFGANNGSIFVVQGSSEATPVVWLSDPEGDQAKMEPL
jgi:anti-sigma factor RsiW